MDFSIFLSLFFAIAVNLIAFYQKFYSIPKVERAPIVLSFKQLIGSFAIYLILSLVIAPLLLKRLITQFQIKQEQILLVSSLQSVTLSCIFLLLCLYWIVQDVPTFKRIWKNGPCTSSSLFTDLGLGALCWFLSFPVVAVVNHFSDLIVTWIFGKNHYEQAAVRFVKMSMGSPLSIFMALISVIILAPVIEEFLFRGLLQNYFKCHLGRKTAIFLSSVFFAIFHLSANQGVGNLSLAISLLILGGFLGFIYERQASLFASISLHMTFNGISAFRIFFYPES